MFNSVKEFKTEYQQRLLDTYAVTVEEAHPFERYEILAKMVRDEAGKYWRATRNDVQEHNKKQVVYFSMEFLIGRLLVNNMQNLGVYEVAKKGLADLGVNIHDLEEEEADAGLGNGGLGRLAACFLDSTASLGYPIMGNTIRYEYGFFKQLLEKGKQFEVPDQWLNNGFAFEVRKPKHSVEVQFGGEQVSYAKQDGSYGLKTINSVHVKAVPYDVSVIGYKNQVVDTLRLWSAEPSEKNLPKSMSFEDYLTTLKELSHGLYPDDSTEKGKILRLRQQYFLVSSGLQSILRGHFRQFKGFKNLPEYYVIQLNDTHPILAIPELMRLMMDNYGMGWDESWQIVQKTFAFTNHTIMQEALEKWPVEYLRKVCPRCMSIIEEINRRFNAEMNEKNVPYDVRDDLQIIRDGRVNMANLGVFACFSVNGVAKLHTDILKRETFKYFYQLYPEKFNNKTNGVTHRRWLLYANPELAELVTSKIGDGWILDMEDKMCKFTAFQDDPKVQKRMLEIKQANKHALAEYIKKTMDIEIDENSIFDVQIKRMHAYKRQIMKCLHIMYLYQRIKEDPSFKMVPKTFIFGAKAAPSYVYAKKIIQLILAVANVVNNDEQVNKLMKVVFVENYGVTLAEKIIPAADVSEQISTASKEASGTSNMKLMMNGAITLGTLDGANVEIKDLVGEDNCVIFGLTSDEVFNYYAYGGYSPWDVYNNDERVKKVMDSLFNGPWTSKPDEFQLIFDEIMRTNDQFFILKDLPAYIRAMEKIDVLYQDKAKWAKMMIVNVGQSGYFTSDRTIRDYVKDIWHLDKITR